MKRIIVLGAVIVVLLVVLLALLFSGFVKLGGSTAYWEPEPTDMVLAPSVVIDATVIDILNDELTGNGDCEQPEVCPRDSVTLRVDSIDRAKDPKGVVKVSIGSEYTYGLTYSSRPAKLVEDVAPNCGNLLYKVESNTCVDPNCNPPAGEECMAMAPTYEKVPSTMEGQYIVYHLPKRSVEIKTTILPGFDVNSKIRAAVWQGGASNISTYEII